MRRNKPNINRIDANSSWERGKTGGHEPTLFPLPSHILAFFSSGSHESHRYFPFRTTTLTLPGKTAFFKWYINGL